MSYPPPPPPATPPPPGSGPGPWPPAEGPDGPDPAGHDPKQLGEEPRTTSPIPLWVGILVAVLFVLPLVGFFLLGALFMPETAEQRPMSQAELTFALAFTIVVQLGLFAVAVIPLLAKRLFGRALWGSGRPLAWAIGLAVGVVATLGAYIVMTVIGLVFAPEQAVEQQIMQDALRGGAPAVLAIFVAVVVAPVTEEVVFRGALFRSLRARMGVWPAAIASSLVFTFIHVEVVTSQPLALTGLFLLGVAFAIALQKSGSLLVPILAHAVFNATSITLAFLVERFGDLAAASLPLPPGV